MLTEGPVEKAYNTIVSPVDSNGAGAFTFVHGSLSVKLKQEAKKTATGKNLGCILSFHSSDLCASSCGSAPPYWWPSH